MWNISIQHLDGPTQVFFYSKGDNCAVTTTRSPVTVNDRNRLSFFGQITGRSLTLVQRAAYSGLLSVGSCEKHG